ncbi:MULTISPECIES: helix-turn-helix domain-containing protein [Streptomyces]|uniref:helix-turn-helix domain-containing protein n=1 Tax=Streptomyces TaxID=1883 RepID=UPI002270FF8F|nr:MULTISPECIES: helix-turn-helix transcriptional regulator [unclassified Streptomyces]MCY0941570.1 helix-turn-helix transcriptional regulator [Streptomyces sp. H34-AA3]MCY0953868.1 helix-turn-helix transcriptional regulator [Streptomyces sp. H27-S2]MCZ4081802.1 helix-turn-helix transcriptional regulator [Streptomyces sp. H34-S5]
MSTHELDAFAAWIEGLMRERGYDIDAPRGGGKSRIADEAGVHRAAVTRLLQRQSMPDLETMRRIAPLLGVSVRDMLVRSGRVSPEELPLASQSLPPGGRPTTIEDFARWLGVPESRREVFGKVVSQFLEPDAPAAGKDASAEAAADAPAAAEGRRRARD